MPNAYALRDTALHAADACGTGGHGLALGNHHLTADERALIARLATDCPGLIQTVEPESGSDAERWHAAVIVSPRGSYFGFYRVAPACYEPANPHRGDAEHEAYHALVQLAAGEEPDLARARERHVPHPSIPTDGEERVA